jgi:pyruvate dehydrogenase E2 component (dihydrolipoamide acetyltransferase)
MATEVIMPKLGMTMEEGTIVRWLREEGDQVEKGEPILEIETDKVVMEVEAPASGTLAGISAGPDEVVPVTEVIAYILEPGEKLEGVAKPPVKEAAPPPKERVAVTPRAPTPEEKIAVTPRARRLAREHEVDLAQVQGSGPGGRIVEADVLAFIEKREVAKPSVEAIKVKERVPLRGRRKTIAERMLESARTAPHIALTVEVDMSEAERTRGDCSFTALFVQAVARALRQHPMVNASLQGDEIILYDEVNVGVAAETKEGLLVPVVKGANAKDLVEIDAEIKSLAQSASEGTLTLEEVSGGTFTVSNLGMFGVEEFQALINPPQSAILAIGAIVEKPVVRDGQVVIRPMVKMTLSADHRVLDGAAAAEFLQNVKSNLERPTEKV